MTQLALNTATTSAFKLLVKRFGKNSGSHLTTLFNHFFVPQTQSQWRKWRNENLKGIHNQNLILFEKDLELVRNFFPSVELKPTKSGTMFRIVNFEDFQKAVKVEIFKLA